MQILPSPALASVVKHFLIIENSHTANMKHRMFSDGNTGIVFNYGDALLHHQNMVVETLPKSFIYGQLDAFQNITSVGKMGLLIVVFHPFGSSGLLKIPAVEMKNTILNLDCFYPNESEILLNEILNKPDPVSRISVIENFLICKLKTQNIKSELANHAVHLINQHDGNLTMMQLTSTLQVSERQLQRIFEEHIGLTPKRFSGIIRIQHFLKLIRHNKTNTSLTNLVYESGFYDQAHLIREMKNISGITPTEYVSQKNLLAANFLQIPHE